VALAWGNGNVLSVSQGPGEEDGVGGGSVQAQGDIAVGVHKAFPHWVALLGPVLLSFVDEFQTDFVGSEDDLVGNGLFSNTDFLELFVLLGDGSCPWVNNDGGVWELVVREDLNVSGRLAAGLQMDGGDGNLEAFLSNLLGDDAEWQVDGHVAFETNFVVSLSHWDFGVETEFHLSTDVEVEVGLDARLLARSLNLELSNSGKNDWHGHAEGDWESEDGWDLMYPLPWLHSPLEAEALVGVADGVGVKFQSLIQSLIKLPTWLVAKTFSQVFLVSLEVTNISSQRDRVKNFSRRGKQEFSWRESSAVSGLTSRGCFPNPH